MHYISQFGGEGEGRLHITTCFSYHYLLSKSLSTVLACTAHLWNTCIGLIKCKISFHLQPLHRHRSVRKKNCLSHTYWSSRCQSQPQSRHPDQMGTENERSCPSTEMVEDSIITSYPSTGISKQFRSLLGFCQICFKTLIQLRQSSLLFS